ncbi:MAG: hypothetical protein ACFBSG_10130 [Leptolyngbyaceae cyanobacterium]
MTTHVSDSQSPAPDDSQHLADLRSLVERVMADGKISSDESAELRAALMADGQITPDEIALIRAVMKAQLGNQHLELE